MLIYEISLRVRLYAASKVPQDRIEDLSERECVLLELLGMKEEMSISEICKFYSKVSSSTISMTITRLWKDKKLVDKKILPENQRITIVSLTEQGRNVLEEVKKKRATVYKTLTKSLELTADHEEIFRSVLENSISFFDRKLGLKKADQKN
jgi:DNA-binding MarR family transcriptional regulator